MIRRRTFLRKTAMLPLCGATSTIVASNALAKEGVSGAPRLDAKIKLSLNAWSFNKPLFKHLRGEEGGMSLYDLLDECARLDFEAVDPTGYFFPGYPEVPEKSFLSNFKRRAFQLGLDISGTGVRNDFATADPAKRKADVDLAKRWIEASAEMGAPVLRVFAEFQPEGYSWDEAAKWVADSLSECAEHGAKHGVMIGIQNHGHMLKSADEVLKLLALVDSNWLGVIVDTGSFLTPDPYEDIDRVIPHAVSWQVKNLLGARGGDPIDLPRLVKIIKDSGYRGYVPIETVPQRGQEEAYDASIEVPKLLNQFRAAL